MLALLSEGSEELPSIDVLTESSPFTEESSSSGEATEFTKLLLDKAGLSYDLSFLPWRRAYRYVLEQPNVLIYPLAQSPQREERFAWVGELIPVNYYLFKRSDRTDIVLESLEDANNYRVGVVNYYVHHEYLTARGLTSIQPVNSSLQNFKKALLGRIDLFPMSESGLSATCRRDGIDCEQFEPVIKLEGISGSLQLAFNKDTDPKVLERVRAAYDALVADGSHARVFAKRFREIDAFNQRWPEMRGRK
ncbi:MAG: ABC transporter substrate-binding protein [Pseudomonadota bacterium]